MLPPQLSIVTSLPKPSPHKRHSGRNYWPAPSTAALAGGGIINSTVLAAFADKVADFLDGCFAVGYVPVTIVKVSGVDAAQVCPLLRVDDIFDTQRRRGYENFFSKQERTLDTV